MSFHNDIDALARRVEREIQRNEKVLAQLPEFPPRPGKFSSPRGLGVIPVEELRHGR